MSDMKTLLENFARYSSSREEPLSTGELLALMNAGWGPEQLRGLNKTNLPPEAIEILVLAQAAGLLREGRFTGGSIDIDPLSDEEQTDASEAYYELFEFLADSNLPGNKPSEKLQYALRWIAKFEQGSDGDAFGGMLRAKEDAEARARAGDDDALDLEDGF
jgi:hypothetical protein